MANPITSNLARLADFKGREPRRRFWLYVASIVAAYAICFAGIMVWTIHSSVSSVPDTPSDTAVFPSFGAMMWANSVLVVIAVLLLSAAVSRRLHDSDTHAWWALLPVPPLIIGLILMAIVFDEFLSSDNPNISLFGFLFVNNLVYVTMLGLLCTKLVAAGSIGNNRFGPHPNP